MRSHRWLALLLALLFIGVPLSASAEANNVILIDAGDPDEPKELPKLLGDDEVEKIERLQTVASWSFASAISPDDRRVLAFNSDGEFAVMSIEDGSYETISLERLGPIIPLIGNFRFDGFQWLDESTVAVLAVDLSADSPANAFGVLYLNVDSGRFAGAPLRLSENSLPISLAPSGERVLVLEVETPPEDGGMRAMPTRFPLMADRYGAQQPRLAEVLAAAPQLRPFLPETKGFATYRTMQVAETTARLKVLEVESGDSREIASFGEGVAIADWNWRPDSAELAMSLVGVYDPKQTRNSGRERLDGALISEELYRDVTGNLPPEINPGLQRSELRVFDLASGETHTARSADTGGDLFFDVLWAPDNSSLMARMIPPGKPAGRTYASYSTYQAERSYYRFYDRTLKETGRFEAPQVGAPFSNLGFFASPDEVIFYGLSGTNLHPYYYNRVSGEFRNLADQAGSYYSLLTTRGSRQLIYMFTSFTTPPDLYRKSWDGSGIVRLTWDNEELRQFSQTREYPVSFTLRGGKRYSGTLILPADVPFPPKNVPIAVWQEGGPGPAMNGQWLTNVENPYGLLPNFGVGLLVVPLSGREGTGPAAMRALSDRANFGQIDIDEQAEISRQMISRGWTSSGKLGIVGCSYGGYFAWQSVIRHPSLYRAANPQCALVDVTSEWARGYAALMPALQGVPPWTAPAEYAKDSPSYNAGPVRAAVLSFHGTDDFLPITLNENLHLQMVNKNLPARMVKFEGAGHGLAREEYQLYAAQEQIAWFRQYLK